MLNFWLDFILFITLLIGFWLQLVNSIVFPAGTAAQGWSLWGLNYDSWTEIQFWVWCVFALLVVIHVMLHWTWICGLLASRLTRPKRTMHDGERTLFGVSLLVVVFITLGIGLAAAMFSVIGPGAYDHADRIIQNG